MKRLLPCLLALALCTGLWVAPARVNAANSLPQKSLDFGAQFAALVDLDGDLWMWGLEAHPDGSYTLTDTASNDPIPAMTGVASVSCGFNSVLVLKKDCSVWAMGNNQDGQLGTGSTKNLYSFQKIMDGAVDISMSPLFAATSSQTHAAAIKSDGSVWTWGGNDYGQLGNGKKRQDKGSTIGPAVYSAKPQKVLDSAVSVVCGNECTAAVKTDGSLWMWGMLPGFVCYTRPTKIMDNVASVSLGYSYAAVVKTDGSLWTWGLNTDGQLGTGNTFHTSKTPKKIMDNVACVSCGYDYTAILKQDGTLWMCGSNRFGQLGNGEYDREGTGLNVPSPFRLMDDIGSVFCTNYSTIAIRSDGSFWSWGVWTQGLDKSEYTTTSRLGIKIRHTPGTEKNLFLRKPTEAPPPILQPTGFYDVPKDAYYSDAVLWAVDKGITNGTGGNYFSPDRECTIVETMTMIWRAYGCPEPQYTGRMDIALDSPYYKAACWYMDHGMNVATYAPCERYMAAELLWSSAGCPKPTIRASFSDVAATHAISWAVEQGITTGTGPDTFSPEMTCTRAQIVTFLYRAFGT